jgi:hypothetical protein
MPARRVQTIHDIHLLDLIPEGPTSPFSGEAPVQAAAHNPFTLDHYQNRPVQDIRTEVDTEGWESLLFVPRSFQTPLNANTITTDCPDPSFWISNKPEDKYTISVPFQDLGCPSTMTDGLPIDSNTSIM